MRWLGCPEIRMGTERFVVFAAGLSVFLFGGCEHYRRLALDGTAGDGLSSGELAGMRTAASAIRHPILRPLAVDLRDGLSPEEAGVMAVVSNPSLRSARDGRGLAGAQVLQAGLLPNPRIRASGGFLSGNHESGLSDAYGFGVDWDVAALVVRPAKLRGAQARQAEVDLDIAWREWQVAQAAKMAAWRVVCLERQQVLARKTEELLAEQRELVRAAVEKGTATSKEVAVAKVAAREAGQRRIAIEKQAAERRLELLRLLGASPNAEIRVSERHGLPVRVEAPGFGALAAGLERRRPDLLALRSGYECQEAAVRAAILGQFPSVGIGASKERDTDSVKTVGFEVGIELPVFDRNHARIAAERATRRKLRDEYADRLFQARSDIAMLLTGIRFLNRQIAAVRKAEEDEDELVRTYERALGAGRADALVVFDARRRLAATRFGEIELRGQLAEAVCALELAAGVYQIP